jgi:hypothetical protein
VATLLLQARLHAEILRPVRLRIISLNTERNGPEVLLLLALLQYG